MDESHKHKAKATRYGLYDPIYFTFENREPQTTLFRGLCIGSKNWQKSGNNSPHSLDSTTGCDEGCHMEIQVVGFFFPYCSYKCLFCIC